MSETFEKISKVLDGDEAVPRSGVEAETLAWHVDDGTRHKTAFVNDPTGWAHGYKVTELVDRSYANRLQAENAALQQRLNTADQQVDDLTTEVERQAAEFKEWQASHHANYCKAADERDALKAELSRVRHLMTNAYNCGVAESKENDALRAELTKARELIAELTHRAADVVECVHGIDLPGAGVMRVRKLRAALEAHQNAPAAKGEGDEP